MAELDPKRVEDEFKWLEKRVEINDDLNFRAHVRITLLEAALAASIKGEPITREGLADELAKDDEPGDDQNSRQAKIERQLLKDFADQLGLA